MTDQLVLTPETLKVALKAQTIPVPGFLMAHAATLSDSHEGPLLDVVLQEMTDFLDDLSTQLLSDPDCLQAMRKIAPAGSDLGAEIKMYFAWALAIRISALDSLMEQRRDLWATCGTLCSVEDGAECFYDFVANAPLDLSVGQTPSFAGDPGDFLRSCVAAFGLPVTLFIRSDTDRVGDKDLEGYQMTLEDLVSTVNMEPVEPLVVASMVSGGFTNLFLDMQPLRQAELLDHVVSQLEDISPKQANELRHFEPNVRVPFLTVNLVRAAALEELSRPFTPSESFANFIAEICEAPMALSHDGTRIVWTEDIVESVLRGCDPVDHVEQPAGQNVFSEETRQRIKSLGETPIGDMFKMAGEGVPADLENLTLDEAQDQIRVSLHRVRLGDLRHFLAKMGWPLDIGELDDMTVVANTDYCGTIDGKPVVAYAAMTPPLDFDDPVLENIFQWAEDLYDDDVIVLPLLPLHQIQKDRNGMVKRVVVQGGWVLRDLEWTPFLLSSKGPEGLDDFKLDIESDRLPKALFMRHGQSRDAITAIKDLAICRVNAINSEVPFAMDVPTRSSLKPVMTDTTWSTFVDQNGMDMIEMLTQGLNG